MFVLRNHAGDYFVSLERNGHVFTNDKSKAKQLGENASLGMLVILREENQDGTWERILVDEQQPPVVQNLSIVQELVEACTEVAEMRHCGDSSQWKDAFYRLTTLCADAVSKYKETLK